MVSTPVVTLSHLKSDMFMRFSSASINGESFEATVAANVGLSFELSHLLDVTSVMTSGIHDSDL